MARPSLLLSACCALALCPSPAAGGPAGVQDPLDSVALVQSRAFGGSRPQESRSSADHDRCAAPWRRCAAAKVPRRPSQGPTGTPNAQLVITRSRGEDLRWLDAMPGLSATVYNRMGLDELLPTPRANLVVVRQEDDPLLAKGGPEDGMLRHIVDNYDSLAEVTVFLQGWPFRGCADARDIIARAVLNARAPRDADFLENGAEAGLVPIASTFYHYDVSEGQVGIAQDHVRTDPQLFDPHVAIEMISSLAFNKTCTKVFQRHCNSSMWVAEGSQWAVSRERIQKTPKSRYEHALGVAPGASGKMREAVLEALWPALWGAPGWRPGLVPERSLPVANVKVKSMQLSISNYCVFSTDGGPEKECEEDAGFCLYSKAAEGISDAQGAVELRPMLIPVESTGVCPKDYTFDDGTLTGGGHGSHEKTNIKETIELCADHCSELEDCLSFEWSGITKVCRMNGAANPTGARSGDFVFCRSNSVPPSEVNPPRPETKVADYLAGRISAPRARELRAKEVESDLLLRIDGARRVAKRSYCTERSLAPPALAIDGKKWRLVDVGFPHYHIQVADATNCLTEPGPRTKRPLQPCASNKPSLRWELRTTGSGFQLVSKAGRCLVRLDEGLSAAECRPGEEDQTWQLDMERTGKFYERLSLEMVASTQEHLQMQCVMQLNSQEELASPAGMRQSQVLHWRMVNASAPGPGATFYFAQQDDGGREAYLGCQEERKKPAVVLQPDGYPWRVREGRNGRVIIESEDGKVLQYDDKSGGLFCFPGGKEDSELPHSTMFALGIPKTPAPTAPQPF